MRLAHRVLLLLPLAVAAGACRPPPKRLEGGHPRERFGELHTLAFAGDVVLARRLNAAVGETDAAKPLGDLRNPLFGPADLSLVNLECVLASRGRMQDKGERNSYYLRGRPDLVRVLLEADIDVVNLANNHAGDYGPEALGQTLEVLDAAGIQHVGAGRTEAEALAPIYRTLGDTVVAVVAADATQASFDVRRGQAGSNYLAENDASRFVAGVARQIDAARRHAHLVFLTVHWGPNNQDAPTPARIELAHRLIDAGADAVLGHSAHRVQGVELYRNKPILYDAGNLLWDYDDDGPSHEGLAFRLHFDRGGVRWLEAIPIRLRKNRTGLNATPDASLERFQTLCGELGTEVLRFPDATSPADRSTAVVTIADDPELAAPADPKGVPAAPTRRTPPPELLRPVPDVVVAEVPADGVRFDPPVAFANGIELLGYRIDTPRIRRHRPLFVTTWWRTTAPVAERWEIFLHADRTARTQRPFAGGGAGEHEPGDWIHPTDRWRPGDIVEDRFDLRPFADVPPGEYALFVGMWRDGAQRLELADPTRGDGDNRVPIGTFTQTADP